MTLHKKDTKRFNLLPLSDLDKLEALPVIGRESLAAQQRERLESLEKHR